MERRSKQWVDVAVIEAHQYGEDLHEVRGCAVASDGDLRCFGCEGQPNQHWLESTLPCVLPPGTFVDVDVRGSITCGVRDDGEVVCWGCEWISEAKQCSTPDSLLTSVEIGVSHNCGLDPDGNAVCWGTVDGYVPGDVPGPGCGIREGPFVQVVPVRSASCGLDPEGEISCWGYYDGPVLPTGQGFTSFHMTRNRGCGVTAAGELVCWGWEYEVPQGRFVQVSMAGEAGCALVEDGAAHCWGDATLADEAPSAGAFVKVDVSGTTACAVGTAGEVTCWGATNDALEDGPEPELRCR